MDATILLNSPHTIAKVDRRSWRPGTLQRGAFRHVGSLAPARISGLKIQTLGSSLWILNCEVFLVIELLIERRNQELKTKLSQQG